MTRRLFFPISFSDQKTSILADNRLLSPVDQLELKYGLITFRQLFAIPLDRQSVVTLLFLRSVRVNPARKGMGTA